MYTFSIELLPAAPDEKLCRSQCLPVTEQYEAHHNCTPDVLAPQHCSAAGSQSEQTSGQQSNPATKTDGSMDSRKQHTKGSGERQLSSARGGLAGLDGPDVSPKGGAKAAESYIRGAVQTPGVIIKGSGQESRVKAKGGSQKPGDNAKRNALESGISAKGGGQGAHWGMEHGMVLQRRVGLRHVELRREPVADGESFMFAVNGIPVYAKGEQCVCIACSCTGSLQASITCCAKHALLQPSEFRQFSCSCIAVVFVC